MSTILSPSVSQQMQIDVETSFQLYRHFIDKINCLSFCIVCYKTFVLRCYPSKKNNDKWSKMVRLSSGRASNVYLLQNMDFLYSQQGYDYRLVPKYALYPCSLNKWILIFFLLIKFYLGILIPSLMSMILGRFIPEVKFPIIKYSAMFFSPMKSYFFHPIHSAAGSSEL